MSPSLSVVICAYTELRYEQLLECCAAAHTELNESGELIVVIDYNDALLARTAADLAEFDRTRVIANTESKGLSGARNTGVGAARGEVIAFVDDDARVELGWAETMLRHYSDPAVAGVGGFAVPRWPGARPDWMPAQFYWVVGCSHVGLPEEVAEVRNFIGCNMSFRREVFETVGGFDSAVGRVGTLPVGCEETELCIRYRQANPDASLLLEPSARVLHAVSEDRVTWGYFVRRCYGEGISKRRVAGLVGSDDALSTERSYVSRVLPKGVASGLAGAVSVHPSIARTDSLLQAFAIILGLIVTTLGYLRAGTVRQDVSSTR